MDVTKTLWFSVQDIADSSSAESLWFSVQDIADCFYQFSIPSDMQKFFRFASC